MPHGFGRPRYAELAGQLGDEQRRLENGTKLDQAPLFSGQPGVPPAAPLGAGRRPCATHAARAARSLLIVIQVRIDQRARPSRTPAPKIAAKMIPIIEYTMMRAITPRMIVITVLPLVMSSAWRMAMKLLTRTQMPPTA